MSESIVIVMHDDSTIRESLRGLLESAELRVVTCLSLDEVLREFDPQTPGCLILGMQVAGPDGLEFLQRLRDRGAIHPVVFVCQFADVSDVVRLLRKGAADFFEDPIEEQDRFLSRIQQLLEADIDQRRRLLQLRQIQLRVDSLTPRQRQVMHLVAYGERNKQIARRLGISEKTVEIHRAHACQKLQVKSVVELVKIVAQLDLDQPPGG